MTEHERVFAKCAWRLIPFMALLAFVFVLSALIVLGVGRTLAGRPVQAT